MNERVCDRVGACVVIPVFNNAKTIAEVVAGARRHASAVVVCDDGSTDGTGDRARDAGADVIRFPANRGKGAALKALFAEATRRGFRYALSLDGDGQHRADDLPALVEAIEKAPGTLIVGSRNLAAAGAPQASRFGRRFSNFWVWFETGTRVEDSQCGLRAYPLPECSELHAGGSRYEFEIQILLRAAWAGIPLGSVPVWTLYPEDRVSHFRKFADNVRISLVNTLACTRLLLPIPLGRRFYEARRRPGLSLFAMRRWAWLGGSGPVFRLLAGLLAVAGLSVGLGAVPPMVLAGLAGLGILPTGLAVLGVRALVHADYSLLVASIVVVLAAFAFGLGEAVIAHRHPLRTWTGRSYGGAAGYGFFLVVMRLFGGTFAYLFLYPVVAYYTLFARVPREVSMQFLDRAMAPPKGAFERWSRTYRHFLSMGQCLVDRGLLGAKGPSYFRCTHQGIEHIQNAAKQKRGGILLTGHLGNWEIASGLLRGRFEVPIAIAAFEGEEARLRWVLERAAGPVRPRVITVGTDELSSLEILRALRDGWLVAIQGDRLLDARVVRVPFLGANAPFPAGPFILAAVSGAPLIRTFALKAGRTEYQVVADPPMHLACSAGRPRDEQLREWISAYARRLEELVRAHPYQWFNFYDFWNAVPARPSAGPLPAPTERAESVGG